MTSRWQLQTQELDALLDALGEVDEHAGVTLGPGADGFRVPSIRATASFESGPAILNAIARTGHTVMAAQTRYELTVDTNPSVAAVSVLLDVPVRHLVFAVCHTALAIDDHLARTAGTGRMRGFRHAAPVNAMARDLGATSLAGILHVFGPDGPSYTPGVTLLRDTADLWLNEAKFGEPLPSAPVSEILATLVSDELGRIPLTETRALALTIKMIDSQPELLSVARALAPARQAPKLRSRTTASQTSRGR